MLHVPTLGTLLPARIWKKSERTLSSNDWAAPAVKIQFAFFDEPSQSFSALLDSSGCLFCEPSHTVLRSCSMSTSWQDPTAMQLKSCVMSWFSSLLHASFRMHWEVGTWSGFWLCFLQAALFRTLMPWWPGSGLICDDVGKWQAENYSRSWKLKFFPF